MESSSNNGTGKFKFAIDRGGTFTDVYAICPDGRERVAKLLSEDPSNYPDAPREGIRRILEEVYFIAQNMFILYSIKIITVLFVFDRRRVLRCLLINQSRREISSGFAWEQR